MALILTQDHETSTGIQGVVYFACQLNENINMIEETRPLYSIGAPSWVLEGENHRPTTRGPLD
jgi:hypothetical protein